MPEEKTKENILRKIRALFKLAEDEARRSPEAAEAIAARANDLLLKYAIDRAEVEDESPVDIDAIFIEPPDFGEERQPARVRWTENLAHIIAKAHFCVCTIAEGMNAVAFYGRETDREVAKYIFCKMARLAREHAEKELARAEAQLIQFGGGRWLKAQGAGVSIGGFGSIFFGQSLDIEIIHDLDRWRNRFRTSFHDGFLVGLQAQFDEKRRAAEAAESRNALVFAGALARVEKFVNDATGGREAEEIKPDKYDASAVDAGMKAGKAVDVRADGLPTGNARPRALLTDGRGQPPVTDGE